MCAQNVMRYHTPEQKRQNHHGLAKCGRWINHGHRSIVMHNCRNMHILNANYMENMRRFICIQWRKYSFGRLDHCRLCRRAWDIVAYYKLNWQFDIAHWNDFLFVSVRNVAPTKCKLVVFHCESFRLPLFRFGHLDQPHAIIHCPNTAQNPSTTADQTTTHAFALTEHELRKQQHR